MLNFYKLIEILVSLQSLVITSMIPVYIPLPFVDESNNIFEMPITWQIPTIILLTLIFHKKVVFRAFSIYIILGLFILPVFNQGGSIGYLLTPNFGYLLGFIPGAWICGNLAFQTDPKLELLAFNCLCGLFTVHLTGLAYLIIIYILGWKSIESLSLFDAIFRYSIVSLPGHLGIICAVAVIAYFLRRLLFY